MGIVLVAAGILLARKKGGGNGKVTCEFDERQELIRGKAFKWGFFSYIILLTAYISLDTLGFLKWMEKATACFGIMVLGIAVFAVYAIWHDAYYSLRENNRIYIILFAVVGILNIVGGIRGIAAGDPEKMQGILGENPLNFLVGSLALLILLVTLLKQMKDKREGSWE